MCSSLFSCSTLHDLSVLHAEQCAAMSRNVMKRLANQNRVKCLFDVIDQSDYVKLFTEQSIYLCSGYRGLSRAK